MNYGLLKNTSETGCYSLLLGNGSVVAAHRAHAQLSTRLDARKLNRLKWSGVIKCTQRNTRQKEIRRPASSGSSMSPRTGLDRRAAPSQRVWLGGYCDSLGCWTHVWRPHSLPGCLSASGNNAASAEATRGEQAADERARGFVYRSSWFRCVCVICVRTHQGPGSACKQPQHTLTERNPLGSVLTGFGKKQNVEADRLDQQFKAIKCTYGRNRTPQGGGNVFLSASSLLSGLSFPRTALLRGQRRKCRGFRQRSSSRTLDLRWVGSCDRMSPAAVRGRDWAAVSAPPFSRMTATDEGGKGGGGHRDGVVSLEDLDGIETFKPGLGSAWNERAVLFSGKQKRNFATFSGDSVLKKIRT